MDTTDKLEVYKEGDRLNLCLFTSANATYVWLIYFECGFQRILGVPSSWENWSTVNFRDISYYDYIVSSLDLRFHTYKVKGV